MGWEGSHRTCYLDPCLLLWFADNSFSSHKQEIFYLQWFPKVFSCPGLFCHSLGTPCHCPLLQMACFPAGERHVERSIELIPETSTTMVPYPPFHLSAQQTQGLLQGKRISRAKLHWLSFSPLSAIPRILDSCFPDVLAPQQAVWVAWSSAKGSGAGAEVGFSASPAFLRRGITREEVP